VASGGLSRFDPLLFPAPLQPARTHGQVRHRKAENLRRYFKPSPQAMRELTSILGPVAERRR
jgi:hypothetical protein